MRNGKTAMRLFADGCLFADLRERLDPKDPGADRSRAVGPQSRAIADTFVVATCAAFVAVSAARSSVATSSARDELIDLADGSSEGLNPGFWDAVGCSGMSFWALNNDQAVDYIRHDEIKHGRVAMAAFLGDYVQCPGVVKGKHTFLPYSGYVADVPPQEQGKLEIITFVGMLESYGEIPGEDVPHYIRRRAASRATTFDQGQPPGDPL